MQCSKCGKENPQEAAFCYACATPFVQQHPGEERKISPPKKSKNLRWLGLGLLILVIVLGGYLILTKTTEGRIVRAWQEVQAANNSCLTTLATLPESTTGVEQTKAVLEQHLQFLSYKEKEVHRSLGHSLRQSQDIVTAFENVHNFFSALHEALLDYSEAKMEVIYSSAPRINDERSLPELLKGKAQIPSVNQTTTAQKKIRIIGQMNQGGKVVGSIPLSFPPVVPLSPPESSERIFFKSRVKGLIVEYEKTRDAFDNDLRNYIAEYTASSAYQKRVDIKNRLENLRFEVPAGSSDLARALNELIDTVGMGIDGVINFFSCGSPADRQDYNSYCRQELRRISNVISQRLRRHKTVFGG